MSEEEIRLGSGAVNFCECQDSPESCEKCEACKVWRAGIAEPSTQRCIFLNFYPPNPWQDRSYRLESAGVGLFYALFYNPEWLKSAPDSIVAAYIRMQELVRPKDSGNGDKNNE